MSPEAVILMILAIILVWGGLAVATRFLITHPLPPDEDDDAGPAAPDAT